MIAILALIVLAASGLLARAFPGGERLSKWWASALASRLGPLVVSIICALVVAAAAGTLHRIPTITDEASYLFQSHVFARGHWTVPALPLPEFFSQEHLLVTPFAASKYVPGQALTLTPGVWLNAPGLVPILLTGATGGLLFAVSRRIGGGSAALISVLLWMFTYPVLYLGSNYMSETTAGALWMLAYWSTVRWYQDDRPAALVVAAGAIGFMAITRPLTALGAAIPLTGWVVLCVARGRRWRALPAPIVAGIVPLLIIPIWSHESTGNWRLTPMRLYTTRYETFDRLGFGLPDGPSDEALPADQARVFAPYRDGHRDYSARSIPGQLRARLSAIGHDVWHGWRTVLVPCAVLGLWSLGVEGWIGVASFVSVVLVYLLYWHPAGFSMYYKEVEPVLCMLSARGVRKLLTFVGGPAAAPVSPVGDGLLAVAIVLAGIPDVAYARATIRSEAQDYAILARRVSQLPSLPAIVFVRYGPLHNDFHPLVRNPPYLAQQPIWFAYDRGCDNVRLMQIAPNRTAYLYNEETETMVELQGRCTRGAEPALSSAPWPPDRNRPEVDSGALRRRRNVDPVRPTG